MVVYHLLYTQACTSLDSHTWQVIGFLSNIKKIDRLYLPGNYWLLVLSLKETKAVNSLYVLHLPSGSWISRWSVSSLQWKWSRNASKSTIPYWPVSPPRPPSRHLDSLWSLCPLSAAAVAAWSTATTKPLREPCPTSTPSSMAWNWNWSSPTIPTQGIILQLKKSGQIMSSIKLQNAMIKIWERMSGLGAQHKSVNEQFWTDIFRKWLNN